jgi:cysteine desulfurase/selenocysteine lyase
VGRFSALGDAFVLKLHVSTRQQFVTVSWCTGTGATIKDASTTSAMRARHSRIRAPPEVKLLSLNDVSTVLGTVNPVREICREARRRGIVTAVDGSQAAPHRALDITAIGCDFYAITGHKMCGPTGTGALWARREHLAQMPPFIGGGEMIKEVRFEGTVFNDPPHKFEAGTPNIAGFIGLVRRSTTCRRCAWRMSRRASRNFWPTRTRSWRRFPAFASSATRRDKAAVISFLVEGAHAHDLATLLDLEGVAIRSATTAPTR